jgi:hypothetical protein
MLEKDTHVIWLKTGQALHKYEITSHSAAPPPGHTNGKEVLFLQSDGSGTLAFSSAHVSGQTASPAIGGEIVWTCSS